jgi:hypothetical protein
MHLQLCWQHILRQIVHNLTKTEGHDAEEDPEAAAVVDAAAGSEFRNKKPWKLVQLCMRLQQMLWPIWTLHDAA